MVAHTRQRATSAPPDRARAKIAQISNYHQTLLHSSYSVEGSHRDYRVLLDKNFQAPWPIVSPVVHCDSAQQDSLAMTNGPNFAAMLQKFKESPLDKSMLPRSYMMPESHPSSRQPAKDGGRPPANPFPHTESHDPNQSLRNVNNQSPSTRSPSTRNSAYQHALLITTTSNRGVERVRPIPPVLTQSDAVDDSRTIPMRASHESTSSSPDLNPEDSTSPP
ncbi:hypothetical protein BX600DRAFT_245741 [Xylariales sp. PMI_506]|nr:hypothetical protein BX600DRAFT_245741 [Xylariales sp. PMI_506]